LRVITAADSVLDSIKAAAKDVASDLMAHYKGNQPGEIPGLLGRTPPSGEFYWWTGAILWSTMIDYWHYTGDDTYNDVAVEGITWQSGSGGSTDIPFLLPNHTANMGNDDLGFWAMTAMQAAELNFVSASQDEPSWIDLAKGVFEYQVRLYNIYLAEETDDTCNGGLRWQIAPSNGGHDYKNAISTAVMLNLGARLYRYTGNQTYADWAEKTRNWLTGVGFIDVEFNVYDGAHVALNCTDINKSQFSYVAGVIAQAAAYMYNQVWPPLPIPIPLTHPIHH
jgi:mannan endo-1,6-alpha-mannosidase